MNSFKSSDNIQKVGSDRSVSHNKSSSVTLNELAMKAILAYRVLCKATTFLARLKLEIKGYHCFFGTWGCRSPCFC